MKSEKKDKKDVYVKANTGQDGVPFLEHYAPHIINSEDTLLTRFFAVITVEEPGKGILGTGYWTKRYVVMNSAYPQLPGGKRPDLQYDLKGCTLGRKTKAGFLSNEQKGTLKDNNLIEPDGTHKMKGIDGEVYIKDKSLAQAFSDTMRKDTEMLKKASRYDYSLFLPIYELERDGKTVPVPTPKPGAITTTSKLTPGASGYKSMEAYFHRVDKTNPSEVKKVPIVIYPALLDFLLGWTSKQKTKSAILSKLGDFSGQKPPVYEARFVKHLAPFKAPPQHVLKQASKKIAWITVEPTH